MRKIHAATAQLSSERGTADVLAQMDRMARAAAALGVEVLLFPEGNIHGYDYDMTKESVAAVAEPLTGASVKAVAEMAKKSGVILMAGMFEKDNGAYYNTHIIAFPDGRLIHQRKHNITEIEQNAGLTCGPRERTIFEINGVKCAMMICADSGIEGLPEDLKKAGVELRFSPCGGGGRWERTLGQADLRTEEGRKRYAENRTTVCLPWPFDPNFEKWGSANVACNALGRAGAGTCHQGHCSIVDNFGVLRVQVTGTIVREHINPQLISAVLTWD